jgi:hypothetical protein
MKIEEILSDAAMRQSLGARLFNKFSESERYRRPKEREWLESLRQIKGLYDPSVKIVQNRSRVYPKMTRKYCNMVLSRMHEMLFPDADRNWDMEPTPEPSIAKPIVAEIARSLMQAKGQPISDDELNMAIRQWAKITNEKMRTQIDDQLLEIRYTEEAKRVLRSGVHYGTGLLKGPLVDRKNKRKWRQTDEGDYAEEIKEELAPYLSFTRIWDWYPDMSVTEAAQMQGSWERHVMNRKDLITLAAREDFDSAFIKTYITEHPNGDTTYKQWEMDLQSVEREAGADSTDTGISTSGTIYDSGSSYQQREKSYEVLEYWGVIDAIDIAAIGAQAEDPTISYEVQLWTLGRNVIMWELAEGAKDIYKIFYFEKDETSIYGEGLPRIMRHSQAAIGAAARMILDNGAIVAGPSTEINYSLLMPGQDITNNHPFKIWYREGRGVEAQYPAIRSIDHQSHISELLEILKLFREIADEETTMPTWMISSPVKTNETSGGASMRMGMLTVSVKDIVRNFDTFTETVINSIYEWNMRWNPRKDIKGDFKVSARGVSSLVGKEVRMQAMNQFKLSLTPEDWAYIPRRGFLEEMVKTHDLRIEIRTEQEAAEYTKSISDPEINDLMKEEKRAEISYRKAQALGALTKAKKHNVDANKEAATPPEVEDEDDPRLADEEVALRQTDRFGKEAEIRRQEESHALDMQHQDEAHKVDLATGMAKTAHGMKLKEIQSNQKKKEQKDDNRK